MRRRHVRQREAGVSIGLLLLSVLVPSAAGAADPKLIVKCGEPASAAVTCDVRASGAAEIKALKATVKGESAALETRFEPFDAADRGSATAYLIQLLPNARRTTLSQMGDAVVTLTDQRGGKRRFMAYTFANDLSLVADSGSSKAEFVRQIIAIKPRTVTVQLYKVALEAIDALSREAGERKALVILADGTSDDTGYSHDGVVTAARAAGVTIHVLGYFDDRNARPQFQKLARLAEDTGGFAAEVKQGSAKHQDFTKDIITNRFAAEVLENGGTATVALKGRSGRQVLVVSAELADGKTLAAETEVAMPAAVAAEVPPAAAPAPEPEPEAEGVFASAKDWMQDHPAVVVALGVLLGVGLVGLSVYGSAWLPRLGGEGRAEPSSSPDEAEAVTGIAAGPDEDERRSEAVRAPDGRPVIYGWLETLDGNAARHPLKTTNVRVGRHRDNDICLQNDSISRRHAVLHYNAETRRFVITDLGAGNGVVVNKTKYKSRELNDGDTVELGEVRLRFRAGREFLA